MSPGAKMNSLQLNAISLEHEIVWFNQVLDLRIALYFESPNELEDIYQIDPPHLSKNYSEYAKLVTQHSMSFDERIILLLALIPHIRPQILDTFFIRNKNLDRVYTEFGGWMGKKHSGFLPTLETAVFILAGSNLEKRFQMISLFSDDHFFHQSGLLKIEHTHCEEPELSRTLSLSVNCLSICTSGVEHKPDYSAQFPAKKLNTNLEWNDLVLSPQVFSEVENIKIWMNNSHTIMKTWGLEKTLKPGYRSLFYGPPGTGKTLTAALIGVEMGVDVYRIDLSAMVSKYIGETEKNLANVFDQALNKNWILFFDEADALFGKRTHTSSANDRYANLEVSYLLQRIEDFPGIVILATNLKANMDDAFARRFQSLIYFSLPDSDQRYQIWKNCLNGKKALSSNVDLAQLSSKYELSGGAITNIVRYAAISALQSRSRTIKQQDLVNGVIKELRKEGKTG